MELIYSMQKQMVLLCFLYWHLESFLKEKRVHIKFSAAEEEKNA